MAISDRVGVVELHLQSYHGSHSILPSDTGGKGEKVRTTSLDEVIRGYNLPGVDFVKIDIEGAELLALQGMSTLLSSKRRPIVLVEVHPPNLPEELSSLLNQNGYRCKLLDAEFTNAVHAAPVHLLARVET